MDHPLKPICAAWVRKIRAAQEVKQKLFQDDADEAMRFFNGPYDWLYTQGSKSKPVGMFADDEDWPQPGLRMQSNRVAEMVQLFGPSLYHKNPYRMVSPRSYPQIPPEFYGDPNDPMTQMMMQAIQGPADMALQQDKARAALLEGYLNFTPYELNLKDNARCAIDEMIIKGMGVLWTEVYTVPESGWKMSGSFYDSVNNYGQDPDADCREDCQYIYRRCCHPVWMVERDYQLPPGSLSGNLKSLNQASEEDVQKSTYWQQKGTTSDLLVYWKIYSKMGLGGRLEGIPQGLRPTLDAYGDYVFLAVAENVPYPLNLPPHVLESAPDQEVIERLRWPTPYWKDGTWPCTFFEIHPVPGQAWPMSHVKAGIGELKFLNWAYSFLASKMRVTSRDFIAVRKGMNEEFKKAITHGPDLTLLEVGVSDAPGQDLKSVVQFLQHPEMNQDIIKVIAMVGEQFEKRVGLTELMYGGTTHQYRSASEAEVKNDQLKIRPDDMATRVEEAMTEVAKKEAICARTHLTPQDVLPILGPAGAYFWKVLIANGSSEDITRQLQYRIEAGSTRKPNRDRQSANLTSAMQNLFTPLYTYAQQTGDVRPVNNLISDWGKSNDLETAGYMLQPPPPPEPPSIEGGKGPPKPSSNGASKKPVVAQ